MDWTKEINRENVCGWCTGGFQFCDGSCFSMGRDINKRKKDHIKRELLKVKARRKELKDELEILKKSK